MSYKAEISSESDKCFDFCMYPYKALKPSKNKLKSSNLFLDSVIFTGKKNLLEVKSSIEKAIGKEKVVFGIKKNGDTLGWELYFYNYGKKDALVTMKKVTEALIPFRDIGCIIRDDLPYFMFSIDFDGKYKTSNKKTGFHVYLASGKKQGISYLLTKDTIIKENVYSFYNVKNEIGKILDKVACSAFINKRFTEKVLINELLSCESVCLANKQNCDAIYFSRISIHQLLFFLNKFNYPEGLIKFIEENKGRLDHLWFDAGFDYKVENGKFKIIKSGYYGYF